MFVSLLLTGLCYNLGIWIDKFIFWFNPATSDAVIGPLRASILYDLPIFLAYLSIIPGMAVFLVRIETDFAEWYERVFAAIRGGETLQHIGLLKEQMILSIRQALLEICKVQGLTVVLLVLLAADLLEWLGISRHYLPLFYIDVIGVSIQVVFMALLNVFFYLDKRAIVLQLCVLFVLLNGGLTLFSQMLGPSWFGYGFTLSLLVCVLLGLYRLNEALEDLEYETFMLNR
ncbi:putative exopolysaccharide Exporter (EPS-E) [compost metagenome]